MDNILVSFSMALFVIDVSSEGFKEWVDEFLSSLRFVVLAQPISVQIAVKALD